MKKVDDIGVGGCLLEVLAKYLDGRKQFVIVDNDLQDVGHKQWCSPRFSLGDASVLHFRE